MNRIEIQPRNNWQKAVEDLGFGFHSTEIPYWDESVCYSFNMQEIDQIEQATSELWSMCLQAVQYVIDEKLYSTFHIPDGIVPYLERSWEEEHPSIYGRFDFCFREGQVKMLEFNADTPTSLFEAGIVQLFWLQDFDPFKDQFNSIHEKLIAHWAYLRPWLRPGPLHFGCIRESLEDLTNTEYLRDCAIQAGIDTKLLYMEDIGWRSKNKVFEDPDGDPVSNLFKLYPWEWMTREPFGKLIGKDNADAFFIEPAWKMILSNKAVLPVLWKLFPESRWLLPAYFEPSALQNYVRKPLLSREGANIGIITGNDVMYQTEGEYGEEGFVYQELFRLPDYNGHYPVIGSWVIGQQPAGLGIRDADTLVTSNTSRFVPHFIE